jgi:hypothetical protein
MRLDGAELEIYYRDLLKTLGKEKGMLANFKIDRAMLPVRFVSANEASLCG